MLSRWTCFLSIFTTFSSHGLLFDQGVYSISFIPPLLHLWLEWFICTVLSHFCVIDCTLVPPYKDGGIYQNRTYHVAVIRSASLSFSHTSGINLPFCLSPFIGSPVFTIDLLGCKPYSPTSGVVITSFKPSLPDFKSMVNIDVKHISLPTNLYWCKANCNYYAFLPRECWFQSSPLIPWPLEPSHCLKGWAVGIWTIRHII